MNGVRRGWLVAALAVAVLALVGSVTAVAAGVGRARPASSESTGIRAGYGPGMMGRYGPGTSGGTGPGMMGGYGPGMMGGPGSGMMGGTGPGMMGGVGSLGGWAAGGRYGLPGDGRPVTTLAAAKARAQAFADRLGGGLRAGEVMQFANGYYGELLTAGGSGATEVLIDPGTGAVGIEYGPAMMWNTRYGMHPAGTTTVRVSPGQAVTDAQAWLDARQGGLTAGPATAFPGYYTLHTSRDGATVGMMSVNADTGAVWYHTWHGTFVAMAGQ